MTMTATSKPRAAALPREVAMRLAAAEYQRFVQLLRGLRPEDWTKPTECAGWDVRAMAAHALGMVEMAASIGEQVRQNRAAKARQSQRGGRHTPGFIRRRQLPALQDVGDAKEAWTFGYLIDVILTRDPWMHRVDIARATGARHVLTPDHDGVLVADVVAEWAARHGQPYTLRLTGPTGGEWSSGTGRPVIAMDAVDFCRAVSGRGPADGLLTTAVPF